MKQNNKERYLTSKTDVKIEMFYEGVKIGRMKRPT